MVYAVHANKITTLVMFKILFWREISKLAIGLLAVASLLSPPLGHASYVLLAQAIEKEDKNRLPDLKSMAEQANKQYSEGNYTDSAALWQKILLIVEKHFGAYHPTALSLNNLAEPLRAQESIPRPSLIFAAP